jgi:arylsulfatase A-like enzyme
MLASLATCLGLLVPASAPPAISGGNVCVIVLDDVGPELISACDDVLRRRGRPSGVPAATPAIDAYLAAQGMYFTNAWSMPTCTPSRSAMLTGRLGSRTGIGRVLLPREDIDNPGLEPGVELLPQLLHLAPVPYTCAAVGKWHLASSEQLEAWPAHPLGLPAGRWFDRHAGAWFNFENQPSLPYWSSGYYVWEKAFSTRVRTSASPCAAGEPPCMRAMDVNVDAHDYPSVDTVDDALDLVRELPEPWFLWLAPNAAHGPDHEVPVGLPSDPCGFGSANLGSCSAQGMTVEASRIRCSLTALDQQLARLFCELDFSDTTVILVSDNGTGELAALPPYQPSRVKGSVYQAGVQVPFLVRSPHLAPGFAGTTSDALVSLADVFETVRELAGAPAATLAEDSRSLLPVLRGESASARRSVYTELFGPNFVPDPATGGPPPGYTCNRHDQALRDARFKLVRKWRTGPTGSAPLLVEELYDLQRGGPPDLSTVPPTPTPDWLEQNNLLASWPPTDPAVHGALQRLRRELDTKHPTLVR